MTFRVLIKTLLKIITTWFIIVSLSFFLFLAFNPDLAASSLHANRVTVTAAAIKAEKERLGLDKPILNQYGDWLLHLFRGDLGTSYTQKEPVTQLILEALPNTLLLMIITVILMSLIIYIYARVLIGFIEHWLEKCMRVVYLIFSSFPAFWLGLILLSVFAANLGWFPISSIDITPLSLVLPVLTMTSIYIGSYVRLVRQEILDNQKRSYMSYYRYNGFQENYYHRFLLKNSLTSTFSSLSISLPKLLAGSVIVETLFNFPGMGSLCITAITERDFPLIEGYICIMTILFLILNAICQAYHHHFNARENL